MKILFVGDIVGKPGRNAVRQLVPRLREQHALDLCIGNSENSAGGAGITPESADELLEAGIDLLTSGNHTFAKREIGPYLNRPESRELRPVNYPEGRPGRGHEAFTASSGARLGEDNLQERLFMYITACTFLAAHQLIESMRP